MANINLTIDSRIVKPVTLADLLVPMNYYDKYYDLLKATIEKYIDDYGNLNLPLGSLAYADYNRILDLLKNAMEMFFSLGLNPNTSREMNIAYINNKGRLKKIKEAADYVTKLREKADSLGSDAIIGYDINNPNAIDKVLRGENLTLSAVNRKDLYTTAAAMTQGLDNAFLGQPEKVGNILNQYLILKQQGLDNLSILLTITMDAIKTGKITADLQGSIGLVINVFNNLYNTYSKNDYTSDAKERIAGTIFNGIVSGMQAPKYSTPADLSFLNDALKLLMEATKLEMNLREAKFNSLYYKDPKTGIYRIRPEYIEDAKKASLAANGLDLLTLSNGKTYVYDSTTKRYWCVGEDKKSVYNHEGFGWTLKELEDYETKKLNPPKTHLMGTDNKKVEALDGDTVSTDAKELEEANKKKKVSNGKITKIYKKGKRIVGYEVTESPKTTTLSSSSTLQSHSWLNNTGTSTITGGNTSVEDDDED